MHAAQPLAAEQDHRIVSRTAVCRSSGSTHGLVDAELI